MWIMSTFYGKIGYIKWRTRTQRRTMTCVIHDSPKSSSTTSYSKAYKEYYVVASRAVPLKVKTKYKKKTDESVTSPKSKTASTSKGTRLKSKAKVTKPDMKKQPAKKIKVKGLAVLSKVLDEQVQKTSGTDEGTGTIPGVPDVPPYEYESYKKSWGDSEDEDDNDELIR
nr:hypothetical protein [Tanacetum cinerariifolium]